MTDLLICLNEAHDLGNEVGPSYAASRDQPIWALKIVTDGLDEDWASNAEVKAEGLTYDGAMQMAREFRASGNYSWPPIGPDES